MAHDPIDPNEHAEGGRLRQRHLVAAIAERTSLDEPEAHDLIGEIDQLVYDRAVQGQPTRLPRVGEVDIHMLDDEATPATTAAQPATSIEELATTLARRLGLRATDVSNALGVIAELVNRAAPDAAVYVPGFGYHGSDEAMAEAKREDDDYLIGRLRNAGTSIWLLQCNPKVYDVFADIEQSGDLPQNWSVSRYVDDIRPGDRVVFWLSGQEGGVYALGEIAGQPFRGDVNGEFVGEAGANRWETFAPIDLYLDLFEQPILRSELKLDDRFAGESIIKIPAAANPHPLSAKALAAIIERLPSHGYPSLRRF